MSADWINKQIRVDGPYSIKIIDVNPYLYEVTGPGLVDEGSTYDAQTAIGTARQYNNIWNEARRTAPLPTSVQEALNSGDGTYRP